MADPNSPEQKVSTSIYFRDPTVLNKIEAVAKVLDLSTSQVIERVMDSVIDDVAKKSPKMREFPVNSVVRL